MNGEDQNRPTDNEPEPVNDPNRPPDNEPEPANDANRPLNAEPEPANDANRPLDAEPEQRIEDMPNLVPGVNFDEMDVAAIEVVAAPKEKKKYRKYTDADKQKVQSMFAAGMSKNEIARSTNIPKTNITDWTRDKSLGKQGGTNKLLTPTEENIVVDFLILMGRLGNPIYLKFIREAVAGLLEHDPRSAKLKNGLPGKFFFIKFLLIFIVIVHTQEDFSCHLFKSLCSMFALFCVGKLNLSIIINA